MVKFEVMSQTKAELDSATGKRAEIMVEYLGYLNQLKEGEAGVLTASGSDESPTALRRRIGRAASTSGLKPFRPTPRCFLGGCASRPARSAALDSRPARREASPAVR